MDSEIRLLNGVLWACITVNLDVRDPCFRGRNRRPQTAEVCDYSWMADMTFSVWFFKIGCWWSFSWSVWHQVRHAIPVLPLFLRTETEPAYSGREVWSSRPLDPPGYGVSGLSCVGWFMLENQCNKYHIPTDCKHWAEHHRRFKDE